MQYIEVFKKGEKEFNWKKLETKQMEGKRPKRQLSKVLEKE